jgi:hypothetical protein
LRQTQEQYAAHRELILSELRASWALVKCSEANPAYQEADSNWEEPHLFADVNTGGITSEGLLRAS